MLCEGGSFSESGALQDDADMADWEEAAGISAPLYEIVDTVFELQSRGFFRRQVSRDLPHEALWRPRSGAEQGRASSLCALENVSSARSVGVGRQMLFLVAGTVDRSSSRPDNRPACAGVWGGHTDAGAGS